MKIKKQTVAEGEEIEGELLTILSQKRERIIHQEQVSGGEVEGEHGGYKKVTKLCIWYYEY